MPPLAQAVNTAPAYAALRAVFLWRVVAEYAARALAAASAAHRIEALDAAWWPDGNRSHGWLPHSVYTQYARSVMQARRAAPGGRPAAFRRLRCPPPRLPALRRRRRRCAEAEARFSRDAARPRAGSDKGRPARQGEFALQREVEDGDYVISRSYFHGGVDFRTVRWGCATRSRAPAQCRISAPGAAAAAETARQQCKAPGPRGLWGSPAAFAARARGAQGGAWWESAVAEEEPEWSELQAASSEGGAMRRGRQARSRADTAGSWGILAGETSSQQWPHRGAEC